MACFAAFIIAKTSRDTRVPDLHADVRISLLRVRTASMQRAIYE
jgi:hypothetical protein